MAEETKTGKLTGVVGVVCGLFLYYFWVAVIMAIQFTFFAEPNAMGAFTVNIPLMVQTWLTAGLFAVLHYSRPLPVYPRRDA